jgi:hypothetical protein
MRCWVPFAGFTLEPIASGLTPGGGGGSRASIILSRLKEKNALLDAVYRFYI